jgi:hypothetical protein
MPETLFPDPIFDFSRIKIGPAPEVTNFSTIEIMLKMINLDWIFRFRQAIVFQQVPLDLWKPGGKNEKQDRLRITDRHVRRLSDGIGHPDDHQDA